MELTKLFVLTVFCVIVITTLNPTDASDLKRKGACKRKDRCPRGHNCVGYDCVPVTPKPNKLASYQEFINEEAELDDSVEEAADGGLKRRGACKRKDRCPPGHNCVGYDCIPVTPKPKKLFSYEELSNLETNLDDSVEEAADGGLKRRGACKRKDRCPPGHNCVGYDCIPVTPKPKKLFSYEELSNLETDLDDSVEEAADGGLKRRGACKRKDRCPPGHNCVGYDCIPVTPKPKKLFSYEELSNLETDLDDSVEEAADGGLKRRGACNRKDRCPRGHNCVGYDCIPINKTKAPKTKKPHKLMAFEEYANMKTELNEQNDY